MKQSVIKLESLDIYKASLELSDLAWKIYERVNYQIRKVIGDQFIRAINSIGANIAEGYGRYHYLDKVKFYYNARGSLFESKHWILIMREQKIVNSSEFNLFIQKLNDLHEKLNAFIKAIKTKNR